MKNTEIHIGTIYKILKSVMNNEGLSQKDICRVSRLCHASVANNINNILCYRQYVRFSYEKRAKGRALKYVYITEDGLTLLENIGKYLEMRGNVIHSLFRDGERDEH